MITYKCFSKCWYVLVIFNVLGENPYPSTITAKPTHTKNAKCWLCWFHCFDLPQTLTDKRLQTTNTFTNTFTLYRERKMCCLSLYRGFET